MTYGDFNVFVTVVVATVYLTTVFVGVGAVTVTAGAVFLPLRTVTAGGVLVEVVVASARTALEAGLTRSPQNQGAYRSQQPSSQAPSTCSSPSGNSRSQCR